MNKSFFAGLSVGLLALLAFILALTNPLRNGTRF